MWQLTSVLAIEVLAAPSSVVDDTRDRADQLDAADALASSLEAAGLRVIYDDRRGVSSGVKFKDSELLGVPTIVVVGRRLAHGVVEVKDCGTGDRVDVALDDAVTHLVELCQS